MAEDLIMDLLLAAINSLAMVVKVVTWESKITLKQRHCTLAKFK